MYPEGTPGRMVATVAMISGVLVLALPSVENMVAQTSAGSPEAAFSARAGLRLPQASASLN